MRLLDDLCRRVRTLDVAVVLDAFIGAVKVLVNCQELVNWIVHSLIVGFEVYGSDFSVSVEQILKEIVARDSKESGMLVLKSLRYMSLADSVT